MAPLFLRLISRKSPPQSIKIFVKPDFFRNVLIVFVCYCFSCFLLSIKLVTLKRSVILVLTVAKNVNFKLSGGGLFHDINTKIMVSL